MLTVTEITSKERFVELLPVWEKMFNENALYSPFLTHEWFYCSLASYGKSKEICMLIIKDGSRIIGIAPLWRYPDVVRGIRIRRIEFITNPDTPCVDFIIATQRRKDVLIALIHYLFADKKDGWDVLSLEKLPVESPNCKMIQQILLEQRKKYYMNITSSIPYISIEGDWEAFLKNRSGKFKKTRRNIINRINKLNKVEIQCHRKDKDERIYGELLSVSAKSWKKLEGIAISGWKEAEHFFKTLTNVAGQKEWLMVWLLKVNDLPIAMEYDLEHNGKVYSLRADYDDEYKKYSPGVYLEYHLVKYLFEKGYSEYNTGPGVNNYKMKWTNTMRDNSSLYICNSNWKGGMIWALEYRLFPFLRKIRDLKNRDSTDK